MERGGQGVGKGNSRRELEGRTEGSGGERWRMKRMELEAGIGRECDMAVLGDILSAILA